MIRRVTERSFFLLWVVVSCVWLGCAGHDRRTAPHPASETSGTAWGNGSKVVILVIDGVRYTESFGDSTAAHIRRLAGDLGPAGVVFTGVRNEGLTKTNPGHASILTGTWQEIANDGSERPDAPTIFEYFRSHYAAPAEAAWMIAGKAKLGVCSHSADAGYGSRWGAAARTGDWSDPAVVDTVLSVLARYHPVLLAANLADVDAAGHAGDWEGYLSALETADSLVLEVWSALQNDPFYAGSTTLFVTTDHGRHDDAHGGFRDHGCSCDGCRRIMLLAAGPGAAAGGTVDRAYTQRDLCSTVGEILGCPVPGSRGTVMEEMFVGRLTGAR